MLDGGKIKTLLKDVKALLGEEPIVKDVEDAEGIFFGDLHGDLEAYERIKSYIQDHDSNFIFLGDYVDRGPHSVEILQSLFEMKLNDPSSIILLRGNHETPLANRRYGFQEEVQRKFPTAYKGIYQKFNETFAELPIAATLGDDRVVALHGGIPRGVPSVEGLRTLQKGLVKTANHKELFQVLWNDPKEGIKSFTSSMRGPGIYYFGKNAFENFMDNSNAELMVRAHLAFPNGFRYYFDERLVSLFSVLSYKGQKIQGRALQYRNGKKTIINISDLP